VNDASVIAWLDRLLNLDGAARAAQLAELEGQDPQLHARLVRMCQAAEELNSGVLAIPVADSMRVAQQSSALALLAGETFAGYRLERELGRGGMAVVWLAERADGVVKRQVALKLPLQLKLSPVEARRFEREKDVLAALSHRHIARLYDAGVAPSGQPYIVLEYVAGIPITHYCDQRALGLGQRLAIFLDVLAAVDHAHKHLVVHRDLKPSNILVSADGEVKLVDFGIARLLADPAAEGNLPELTQHGGLALTPLYSAPEQVRAEAISTLTDVYVLGVVLHELLSGTLPHATSAGVRPSLASWVEAVSRSGELHLRNAPLNDAIAKSRGLPSAKRLHAELRGDLDIIVQKATRQVPAQRYASVGHFADDLRHYLACKPIAARRASSWYAAGLFVRRHRAMTAFGVLAVAISLTAGGLALQKQREARMYEARSVAVRDFMYDFVNDAEPNESQPDAPVPFIDMLGGAVTRARNDFADRPQLQGELLSELGRMYGTLGEPDKSAKILLEALTILERSAPPDDPALNKARAFYASVLLDEDEIERARELVLRAREDCTRESNDCTKARAHALTLLGRIEGMDGRPDQALVTRRAALEATISAYGRNHSMTVLSMQGFAIIARNSGRIIEAESTMKQAVEIARHVTLARSDRLSLERMMTVIDSDLGRYAEARARLERLIPGTSDAAERALQLRLLANALIGQGLPDPALESADAALRLVEADDSGSEPLFARQARARALSLLGRQEPALEEIRKVIEGLRQIGYSDHSTEALRARRFEGEILLRAGHLEPALRASEALLAEFGAAERPSDVEWGQVFDLVGCAQRELGRRDAAIASHRSARAHLGKQLPDDHPFLLRNTLYTEVARNNREQFRRTAEVITRELPTGSLWRRRVEAELDAAPCADPEESGCIFLL